MSLKFGKKHKLNTVPSFIATRPVCLTNELVLELNLIKKTDTLKFIFSQINLLNLMAYTCMYINYFRNLFQ